MCSLPKLQKTSLGFDRWGDRFTSKIFFLGLESQPMIASIRVHNLGKLNCIIIPYAYLWIIHIIQSSRCNKLIEENN